MNIFLKYYLSLSFKSLIIINLILELNGEPPEKCICVPFYQCTADNNYLISDGRGMLDIRKINNNSCHGYFDVCCNSTVPPVEVTKTPETFNECGYGNPKLQPWTGVLYSNKSAPKYKCGISLIHPQAALTAAHCLEHDGTYLVKIGESIRSILRILIHPTFNSDNMQNDIAVLILDKIITSSTICIPPVGTVLDQSICIAIKTSNIDNFKNVWMPIVPRSICEKMLQSTRLGPYFQLHHSFICAGGEENRDLCEGDGGSPLVCRVPGQPGRFHQAGITAWGIACGMHNIPGVYVNLPIFRNWIDKVMLQNGLGIHYYRY